MADLSKLNSTNKIGLTNDKIIEVESKLGKQIDSVYTIIDGYTSFFRIGAGYHTSSVCAKSFKPFTAVNNEIIFDENNMTFTIKGRDKWERKMRVKKFSVSIIGYKLNTTHLPSGYIYGNPIEIIN